MIAHLQVLSTQRVRSEQLDTEAFNEPGGYKSVLRMDAQDLSVRNRTSEGIARNELGSVEQDVPCALFSQKHRFHVAVQVYQQQAREAISCAVQASRKIIGYDGLGKTQPPDRHEGQLEDNERRVASWIKDGSTRCCT